MATTVEPASFSYVDFDAPTIAELSDELAAKVGLGADVPITIEIDETSALGHTDLASVDPVLIRTESGALENPKRLRQFSPEHASDVLGRYLLRAADRRSPGFADAPADDDLTLEQRTAWDVHSAGRLARLGYPAQLQRWKYSFRNRHGFTDAADVAFDLLWDGVDLSWDDVDRISAEAAAQNPGPLER